MNNVVIEQVEETKLLGVTMYCKLSWGRSLSIIKCCSAFLTAPSTRQILQALVLSHLDYCSVVWSGATKRDLQLAQNRAAQLALGCTQSSNIINMSISPGSKWRRDWLHHSLYLWEVLTCWMHRAVCLNYWHTARTPMHTPQDMPPEVSS